MEYNVDALRGDALNDENIVYIENEYIKLGLNTVLGGAITYFAEKGKKNMINSQDLGRQVQLSFYGGPKPYCPEGKELQEKWKHCGWNPIQSGDWYFNRSKLLECTVEGNKGHIKCIPMQWALNNCPGECTFELWYTLEGKSANIRARLNNNRADKTNYGTFGQELPAVYSNGEWYRLVSYIGKEPFEHKELTEVIGRNTNNAWPPFVFTPTENFIALLNDENCGFAIYNPQTNQFSGGFSGGEALMGKGGEKDGQTGAISPTLREILDYNIVYEFDFSLIAGSIEEIRAQVYELDKRYDRYHYAFDKSRDHFCYYGAFDKGYGNQDCLDITYEADCRICSPYVFVKDCEKIRLEASFPKGEVRGRVELPIYEGKPENVFRMERKTVDFVFAGGGERRFYEIKLDKNYCFVGAELIFDKSGKAKIYSFEFVK